jgi:hypothetical protein
MCGNYPNCNCPSCTQCQDCTQVTPTCNCTTTCTCSTEQFTEECPNGLQSTDCLIYTGDNLKDCQNNDYLFRGTNFNTFLSQLWETVKCAATATTDTIDYTGAAIKTCDNNTTIVPTNTPVTTALNNIWNHIKCWYTTLDSKINDRQPVWKQGYPIAVDPTLFAPFNNINTAITEITKYHHDVTGPVRIRLSDGSHTLNTDTLGNWNSQSGSFQIECNAPLSATLNLPNGLTIDSFNLILRGIYTKGAITVTNRGQLFSKACLHRCLSTNTFLFNIKNSSSFTAESSQFLGLADGEGPSTPTSRKGIIATNNSTVNILTISSYPDPYYAYFNTLFDITDNSSLLVNNSVNHQPEKIAKILNLNKNSKASFTGSYSEWNGEDNTLTDNIAFLVSNNSDLYIENINFGLYYKPIDINHNSSALLNSSIVINARTGISVSLNSKLTLPLESNINFTIIDPVYYFSAYSNSNINLAYGSFSGTGSLTYCYFVALNSTISFLNGAVTPLPQSSNTYVGTGPTGFLIPNNFTYTNADATKLGCALYLY